MILGGHEKPVYPPSVRAYTGFIVITPDGVRRMSLFGVSYTSCFTDDRNLHLSGIGHFVLNLCSYFT